MGGGIKFQAVPVLLLGNYLTIADLKPYWIINWLTPGILDGIPKKLIDGFKNVVNWRNNITAVREARPGIYGNRGLSPIILMINTS